MPLRPGPLPLRARRVRIEAAAGALVAARVQDEALPLRRLGVPLLRGRPLPVRAHGPRAGVPSRGTRSIPPTQVEELQYLRPPPAKTQDKKYKTRMCRYGAGTCPYGVSCSYAHSAVSRRVELKILFAPSTRKRVGPRAGGAPAARARRAAGRADRRRQPARATPRPTQQRQRLGGRVRGAQAAGPARAGLVRGPGPGAAGADGAATAAAPVAAAAGRLHAARDGDAAARGAATAGVRPAAAVRRGAGAAARVRRATACTSRLRRAAAATVRVVPAAPAAAGS